MRLWGADCRRPAQRSGFTLVEVVVGMVLLASLLVGVVKATTVHKRQLTYAAENRAAVEIADRLLTRLTSQPGGIPRNDVGAVMEKPDWRWQTRVVSSQMIASTSFQTVRLEIIGGTSAKPRVLCSVDVVGRPVSLAELQ